MDVPNYILKTNEGGFIPKNDNQAQRYLKNAVLIIVSVLFVGSFVFHDNLFKHISWGSRILLIALGARVYFSGGTKSVPSPFEIQFYDNYLIIYREKFYYSRKVTRKEYNKFFYKDITKCQYKNKSKRINIYGIIEGTWYDYNKDGSLPEKPTYHKTTSGGICFFYTNQATEVNFVAEIEKHSPIKVIVEES